MNEMINLPRLIALVAERANIQPAEARRFIHELFATVESALLEGENVKIKGIGEFVRVEDLTSPVVLKVDDELAAIVNEPFAAFEAVELNEGAAEEILKVEMREPMVAAAAGEEKASEAPVPDAVEGVEKEPERGEDKAEIEELVEIEEKNEEKSDAEEIVKHSSDIEPESESESEPESEHKSESEHESEPDPEEHVSQEDDITDVPEDIPERVVYVQQPANHGMWLMLGVLIGLIAGLVGGYFAGKYMAQYELPDEEDMVFDEDTLSVSSIFDNPVDSIAPVVKADTVQTVQPVAESTASAPAETAAARTSAQPQPVYDTVSSRRYLAIIAGEHYGVKNYWIFIYNANPDLGDPNKIAPGTRVLVPAKESFMEATKAETDAKARRLFNELSKKYKL